MVGTRTALTALLGVLLAAPAQAATTELLPVADATVRSDMASTSYGTAADLKVDGSPVVHALLRFDASGVRDEVTRATLKVWSHSTTGTGITAHGLDGKAWTEAVTWSTRPALGPQVASSGGFSGSTYVALDVTSLVRAGAQAEVGLATTSSSSKTFSSREAASGRPVLVVETRDAPPPPPPPSSDPVLVAAVGDIACDPNNAEFNGGQGTGDRCRQAAVADLLATRPISAVLGLGDLQYEDGRLSAFQAAYDTSWGRFAPIMRPAPGNHEYQTTGAAGYFDYFGAAAGDRSRGFYAFDLGPWRAYALNTNCAFVGGCEPGSPQEQWLRADLAANPRACVLGFGHHPPQSSSDRGPSAQVRPLVAALQDAGADLLLTGHDHGYERFSRQLADGTPDRTRGIRSLIVGTGGRGLHPHPQLRTAGSGTVNYAKLGATFLELREDGFSWRHEDLTGTTLDAGQDTCAGSLPDTTGPSAPGAPVLHGTSGVTLRWAASTDDDGVGGYRVTRDGVQIGAPTTNALQDTTAEAGRTYRYEVVAVDVAGNRSPATAASLTAPGGAVLRFPATHDAAVRLSSPATNLGQAAALEIDAQSVKDSLLRFDVSATGGRPVRRAVLRLHAVDSAPHGGTFQRTSTAWSESTVTWNTAPAGSGTALGSLGGVVAGTWYEVDVTAAVTGDGAVAFRAASPSTDGADFASAEDPSGRGPELVVELG